MNNAVIVGYVRSPFTPAYKGELAEVRPDELAAQVIKALIEKTGVKATDIDDLILGCAFPEGEQGLNVARLIAFIAGLPISVAGQTVNRFCGSSMQSVHIAAGNIAAGAGEVFIAAGVESMSRVPMTGFNPLPHPDLYDRYPEAYEGMGITAENVAAKYKIKRNEQDSFALLSHQKSAKAASIGSLNDEIISIQGGDKIISRDGCIRAETTIEQLAGLKPAFDKNGVVTAGTSSPLTDGAVALLVTSEKYADKNNLPKLARIKSFAVSGCAPEIMGIGPVGATKKALERAGLTIEDMDIIELNEAFAAQALAVISDLKIDTTKLNLEGGAIALGHPLGASGARITGKAATLLKKHRGKYALATMCIGGGQGIATVLEAV
ncbi:MAG: acetyl-CoA acetyltransferase [Rickettsiaceae bacterium]|jgi:acetyl-CoA acyltransferase|nr:acetyl-CoA acetyltransferase [Rickettsiaceae bacterium]